MVGFVSLKGADEIDLLYVHPAVAGQGIGAMLCDAVERLAGARGTPRLLADASDTARGFFEHRGYVAQRRNTVALGDEWLATTTMEKKLTPKGEHPMTKPETPFPRHWLYYITLKYVVIAAAVLLALYVAYRVS